MSKPDATGGSLESILASIRKSLAEQSTDALSEDAAPAPKPEDEHGDAKAAPRREGLTQRLADAAPQVGDDLADLVAEQSGKAAGAAALPAAAPSPDPMPVAAPAQPPPAAAASARNEGDPLWFLTPGPETNAAKAAQPASGAEEPALRPEVLRASLPPFFGSSAEAEKVEVVAAPVLPVSPPLPIVSPPAPARGGAEAEPVAEVRRAAPAAAPSSPAPPAAAPLRNGRANAAFESPAEPKDAPAGASPHIHGLEAVVVDMLKPMLRQWLDENMPRLVASALADEAAARARVRDPNKP
jgi:cell pole-organizing protein PopZ